jgi:hypothetical protein
MRNLIKLGIVLSIFTFLNGCNTVKGTAEGFNKDVKAVTGHGSQNQNNQSSTQSNQKTTYNTTH